MAMNQTVFLTLAWIALFSCVGCERDTKLSVEGGNPPKFLMTGTGRLDALRVGGPQKQREGVADDPYVYWAIEFKETGSDRKVESLGPITYGEVPAGYVQLYPKPGESPPPLPEDELCGVKATTINENGAGLRFAIHKGKVVIDPVTRNGKPIFPD